MRLPLLIVLALTISVRVWSAGGIRGMILDEDGVALPYATVYIKETGTGAPTNPEGRFEIALPPGQYRLVFQHLGYETQERTVVVGDTFHELNIRLKTQAIVLQTVVVTAGEEDPAYTIMRKAIAKAKYHTQQIDTFSAKVYIKGSGQLTDYPRLARRALEKEGIKKDRVFVGETVSQVRYRRPNTFEEKVVSVRSDGDDNGSSPNAYIFGSFYEPEIAETVSPLSPRAFGYYRFEYQGSFKDRTYDVSKIKVVPRSPGENVFEGTIYIVEDLWSIHSLDLTAVKLGIRFLIKQIYAPVADRAHPAQAEAWLPVSHHFHVTGSVFGFAFEYTYLASVSDYQITINTELPVEVTVIDEKVETERAELIEEKMGTDSRKIQERLNTGEEVTRKELNKMLREYEKEERKEEPEPEVISNVKFSVDSLAHKKDSTYWNQTRPIPLTPGEIKGYHTADSIAAEERRKAEGDSLKPSKNEGFQLLDILRGDSYRFGERTSLRLHPPLENVNFNTVEGLNLDYRFTVSRRFENRRRLSITPLFRYAFSRQRPSSTLRATYSYPAGRLTVEGGRYIRQYNGDQPITQLVNSLTTLFLEQNWMKILERDFIDIRYRQRLTHNFYINIYGSWSERRVLSNTTDFSFIHYDKEAFTPNAPVSQELTATDFPEHQAGIGQLGFEYRPGLKYRIRNGNKYRIEDSAPILSFDIQKGIEDVDFTLVEAGFRHGFDVGLRGRISLLAKAGKFLNDDQMYFMDFKHFPGNRTPFVTSDVVGAYRLLDYYTYSTREEYLMASGHFHFRKLLVSRFPMMRLAGLRENLFVNYLATPTLGNYVEAGYGLDNLLRIFRLEAAFSMIKGDYNSWGIRIGLATSIGIDFGE